MTHLKRAVLFLAFAVSCVHAWAAASPRTVITQAILTESAAEKRTLISSLSGSGDEIIPVLLDAWRKDAIFLYPNGSVTVPVLLTGEKDAAGAQTARAMTTSGPPPANPSASSAAISRPPTTPARCGA